MDVRVSNLRLILVSTLPILVPTIISLLMAAYAAITVHELSSRGYICLKPESTVIACKDMSRPWGRVEYVSSLSLLVSTVLAIINSVYTLALFAYYGSIEVSGGKVVVSTLARSYKMYRINTRVSVTPVSLTIPPLLGPTRRVTLSSGDVVVEMVLHAWDAELLLRALPPDDRDKGAPMD